MRTFLGIVFLLHSINSYALKAYSKSELEEFLKKKDNCLLAVGMVHFAYPKLQNGMKGYNNMVLCVSDMTVNAGTINQAKGCVMLVYNVENDLYKSTYGRMEDPSKAHKSGYPMSEKSCGDGGIYQLEKVFPGAGYGATVAEALTLKSFYGTEVDLVYAATDEYRKYWDDLKAYILKAKIKKPK